MDWKSLTTLEQLPQIKEDSNKYPVIIYKHSARCGISSVALDRLERAWRPEEIQPADAYFLDLLRHRDVSQAVAQTFSVHHESPQILLINEGKCVYNASHMTISYSALKKQLEALLDSSV